VPGKGEITCVCACVCVEMGIRVWECKMAISALFMATFYTYFFRSLDAESNVAQKLSM
jgi:hypothetical protein